MDILFIKAGNQAELYQTLGAGRLTAIEPPLWHALLAAYMRKQGYSVGIIDAEADDLSHAAVVERVKEMRPAVAAVVVSGTNPSASTWNMTGAGLLLAHLKETAPGVATVIAGLHPSALPRRTIEEEKADFLCQGEGFFTLPALVDAVKGNRADSVNIPGLWRRENGRAIQPVPAPDFSPLDDLPMPAWDLLPMEKYRAHNWHCFGDKYGRQPYGLIYSSLGCPFRCSFCCINALFGKHQIRYRSPDRVIEEIDFLVKRWNIRTIKIIDEMFVLKPSHVERFCDLVIERNYDLNFWAYARVDTVSERLLERMKKAGINWLAYGFEAGDPDVLNDVSKGYKQDELVKAVEMTKAAGIYIIGNYIFGLPEDTIASMRRTLDMAKDLNCEFANMYCCMAYPGSRLYEEAARTGIKLPETWEGYSQLSYETLPLPTKHITAAEVLRFRDAAFMEYYTNPVYLEMIGKKFGPATVESVRKMAAVEIKRRFA